MSDNGTATPANANGSAELQGLAKPESCAPEGTADARHRLADLRHDPAAIRRAFETGEYPYKKKLSRAAYEKRKTVLQVELLKLQTWVQETGKRVIILCEGRDAAGKGGTIKRFMEHLNPRSARVIALPKPTERELGQWYFQRYVRHLPARGEIVFFDRSWYNRAVVEPVMGFCSQEKHELFMDDVVTLGELIALAEKTAGVK